MSGGRDEALNDNRQPLVAEVHHAIARINALGMSVPLIEQAVAGALRLVQH